MFHRQESALSIEAGVSGGSPVGPTTRAKASSSGSDAIPTHNPKKRKLSTHQSMERLRSLRPRPSSSEDSENELSRVNLAGSIR